MKFKIGQEVRIKVTKNPEKINNVCYSSDMFTLQGKRAIIEGYNNIPESEGYRLSTDNWNWTEAWIEPYVIANKLNRKLYPSYIEEDGFLVPPKTTQN